MKYPIAGTNGSTKKVITYRPIPGEKAKQETVQVLQYGQMRLRVMMITPDIAKQMLDRNMKNRSLRPSVVQKYKRDMESGAWHEKPLAICLDESGLLGNGQHTLNAIVESGIAQNMLIAENVSHDTLQVMDEGLRRSVADAAAFAGASIDNRQTAIARIIGFGIRDTTARSFYEVFTVFQAYQDHIEFACSLKSGGRGTQFANAPVMSVIALASMTEDTKRILEFVQILNSGITNRPEDRTVIALRDMLNGYRSRAGNTDRVDIYYKTQNALRAWLDGRILTRMNASTTDYFSVPE